jgi:hypothetical protein
MKNFINKLSFLIAILLLVVVPSIFQSCEKPEDDIIRAVRETNAILIDNEWKLTSFELITANEDIPPPLLFTPSDIKIPAGIYDLEDMVLDASDMANYIVNFTSEREIRTRGAEIDLLNETGIGSYFVLNDRRIRLKSEQSLVYHYIYNENSKEISFIATEEDARRLINKTNQKLIDAVIKSTPSGIGDFLAELLFNNEALQGLINDVVVDAISGKLDFIYDLDPEETSELLAALIFEELRSIDWENFIYEAILGQLEEISNIDQEAVANLIAQEVAAFIDENFTTESIYNTIFPYINEIPANSEYISESIATLVSNIFLEIFTEANLQPIISSAWQSFVELSPDQVSVIADTLTGIVQEIYLNEENLSNIVLPFTQLIDNTPVFQLGQLAAQTTQEIENLVNIINSAFPELELDPDYESMENSIRLAYIAIKPVITIIGPEAAANQIAELLLNEFLTESLVQSLFVSAIEYLQNIDAETAGIVITQWLLGFQNEISEGLYNFVRDFLSPILDNLDPEGTSLLIAEAVRNFVIQNFNQENIFQLILPIIDQLVNLSAEEVAAYLAKLIINLDIIEDTITEEAIAGILSPVLESIQELEAETISQAIVNALVASNIFQDNITEERISLVISLLIYNSYWQNVRIANNFEEITIVLRHE